MEYIVRFDHIMTMLVDIALGDTKGSSIVHLELLHFTTEKFMYVYVGLRNY